MQTTPLSLLERLRRSDEQAAWEHFVRLYSPLLTSWAHKLGQHGQEAEDLVQDVFALLVQKLPEFRYDPQKRFRSWLWTVTVNKCRERLRRRQDVTVGTDEGALAELAGADDTQAMDEAEYRAYLVKRALELMQDAFQAATWKAFWECTVNSRPAAEVAAELGLSENAVYLAKGRVLRRLRQELEGLLD
jgi:RNA polymerase sigma-70 factor (ECF subfamily)